MSRQRVTEDGLLAETSVRADADELDVAPSTPLRGIRRLRAVGVEATPRRSGRVDRDTHRLLVPTDALIFGPIDPSTIDPDHNRQPRTLLSKPRQSRLKVEQLQLFPQG